jgi:HK97 family phage portal protein
MTYEASGFDPTNLQMIEAREFQVREIARLMRIPAHMIGATGSTSFAAVEQQSIDFRDVLPHRVARQLRADDQARACSAARSTRRRRMFVQHDPRSCLRADSISRARIDSVYRLAGILTSNEIRETLGREPKEGGDVLWQPVNVSLSATTASRSCPASIPALRARPMPARTATGRARDSPPARPNDR